jgi:hypothetical protein
MRSNVSAEERNTSATVNMTRSSRIPIVVLLLLLLLLLIVCSDARRR